MVSWGQVGRWVGPPTFEVQCRRTHFESDLIFDITFDPKADPKKAPKSMKNATQKHPLNWKGPVRALGMICLHFWSPCTAKNHHFVWEVC